MRKEQITDKEAICTLIIFIMGSTLILGVGGEAKNDAWIAGILGIVMAIPIILVYSRILSLFPGKDLYEILSITLGKILGKVIAVLYIWYAFHLGALVIRNFGEFVNIVAMPETPIFVPMICLGLVGIIAVRSGVEVIGRLSAYMLPAILFIIAVVQILVIPRFDPSHIKPILANGLGPVLKGGFSLFSFPFAETVLFIGVFFSLKTKKSSYKVYFFATIFAGAIIVFITLRNIAVLGGLLGNLHFPSHVAVSRISIGEFLQRIEVAVAIVFVFGVFIKSSVCLFVACKGIGRLFNLNDYRTIVIQTGLLMIYFSYTVYDSAMEMRYWAFKVYAYYAFPFQVIIPILLLVAAEIKVRKRKISIAAGRE
ncbi:MAG: endospore germination permease [Clostridia bacterium]|nr:endospore germination permease [Clostridia bacterium]